MTHASSVTPPQTRRLSVLQLFNRYLLPGGEEKSVRRIAEDLESGGHQVTRFWRETADWNKPGGPSKLRQAMLLWNNPGVLEELRRAHEAARADVWILHNVIPVISLGVYRLGRTLGVPMFQWLHNYRPVSPSGTLFIQQQLQRPEDRWLRLREIWHGCWHGRLATALLTLGYARVRQRGDFEAVRAWIPVSDEMKRIFQRAHWYPDRLFTLRHSWHAQPRCLPQADEGYFLFLGRITEEKGVRFLVDLWHAPELRDTQLVIAGEGPIAAELAARSPSNVKWVGYVEGETKLRWKAGCRALLFPSIWPEPLSTVAYEAYEVNRPMLASRSGGMPEVVEHGVTGLLLPPGERTAWLQAILRLVRDPDLARQLGEQGRQWLDREVSPERWVERFNTIAHGVGVCS
jgi:glycosyltransferase involved in cell wall biosynthesis